VPIWHLKKGLSPKGTDPDLFAPVPAGGGAPAHHIGPSALSGFLGNARISPAWSKLMLLPVFSLIEVAGPAEARSRRNARFSPAWKSSLASASSLVLALLGHRARSSPLRPARIAPRHPLTTFARNLARGIYCNFGLTRILTGVK